MAYDFHYTPTGTGVISGKEVLEQTEDAINDLGNTAISGVQEALDKAEQALTNSENAVDDAQTALNTANNAEGVAIQAQTDVGNLSGTVANIGNRVTTAEGNISNLQGRMTTAEGNITNIQGRMTTAETNIGNLQTAVSTAQATANSAQQTATTARQQSYVFRYSSTALVASSTNSNTLLDNTDNLKVGDKVIDSNGVLFSITAIDTANSTFTIGTALIDLALDANVVHTSGNETISGNKTFNGSTNCVGELNQTALFKMTDDTSFITGSKNTSIYDQNGFQCANEQIVYNNSKNIRRSWTVNNNSSGTTITAGFNFILSALGGKVFYPVSDSDTDNGTSSAYWKNTYTKLVNEVEPSSLSLPSETVTEQIDISSYFTNTGSGDRNTYTASANGWIYLRLGNISGCQATILNANNNTMWGQSLTGSVEQLTIPILKGQTLSTQWNTSSTVYVDTARFIPCQGNV